MRHSGNSFRYLAALLPVALLAAACGGDGGEEEQAEIAAGVRALAVASELTDLAGRVIPLAESVAEAPGKRNRDEAAATLRKLSQEAETLGDRIPDDLDAELAEPLASSGACLATGFATLEAALSSPRGEEAQQGAGDARSELEGCLGQLEEATDALRSEARADARALAGRISSEAQAIDELLGELATALARPISTEEQVASEAPPEPPPGDETPVPSQLEPPPGEAGEVSDLPPCDSGAPPPCVGSDGSVVE